MPRYFAHIQYSYGGGWGVSDESPEAALQEAGRHVAVTSKRERNKHPHYVIAFPDDTDIGVDGVYGNWRANKSPYEVCVRHMIPADVNLLGTRPKIETEQTA